MIVLLLKDEGQGAGAWVPIHECTEDEAFDFLQGLSDYQRNLYRVEPLE